jgi:hypothetical protein
MRQYQTKDHTITLKAGDKKILYMDGVITMLSGSTSRVECSFRHPENWGITYVFQFMSELLEGKIMQ